MPGDADPDRAGARTEAPRARRWGVLVVDDDPGVRAVLAEWLMHARWDVDEAACGTEGIARFDPERHDLVLTDLMMPDLTGWEVISAIRARAPGTGIILISGSMDNLAILRARDEGIRLVSKPFAFSELRATIAEVLAQTRTGAGPEPEPAEGRAPEGKPLESSTPRHPPVAPSPHRPGEGGTVGQIDVLPDPQDASEPLAALRAALGHARALAGALEAAMPAIEAVVRDRATARQELDALRAELARTDEDRRRATAEIAAILRRLRA